MPKKQVASASPRRELPTDPEALLTRKEAAQVLGTTERWVERATHRGYFPHIKLGKLKRYRLKDLLAYIVQQERVGTSKW